MSALIDLGREVCGHLVEAERREWLVTNGRGSYASGTVAGTLTRRYHGLLIAALDPPLGRTLLATKLEAEASYDGQHFELFANRWVDGTLNAGSIEHLERFTLDGTVPVWTFALGDALLEQRVFLEPGADTAVVRFAVLRARRPVELLLRVLVNYRSHHAATVGGDWRMNVTPVEHGVRVDAFYEAQPVFVRCRGAAVSPYHSWYRGFWLPREAHRGLSDSEDHLDVVHFRARVAPGETVAVVVSTDESASLDGDALLAKRQRYESERLASSPLSSEPGWVRQLVLAADQFVVARTRPDAPDGLTILAGYPWFGDWGRDTMIALPGLLLATGRHAEAARVLRAWAGLADQGLLPNLLVAGGQAPETNTADATLWFVEAVRAYHAASGDDLLVRDVFPVLADCIEWHRRGTRHGIAVDPTDGLLRAGEPGVQLTWMDAKVGDWIVTPRVGKPVEINALWYNALASLAQLALVAGVAPEPYAQAAATVRKSFDRFWNEARDYLYDVLDTPTGPDPTLRPNQLFAVSLQHSPLDPERQRAVVEACARRLLTSHGLRSLGPEHPAFVGRYGGGIRERDGAYHQGTVWGWLIGPFVAAHLRVYGDVAAARGYLAPLAAHLRDHGLGTVAEIFDGAAPFEPGGCLAQAWSVGEVLRAWVLSGSSGS